MTERSFEPDWFSKPGDTLAALMRQRQISVNELAAKLQTNPVIARGLLAGTIPIDEGNADKLAKAIGGSRSFWIKRQSQFDSALSQVANAVPDAAGLAWAKRFPVKEMSDCAWIRKTAEEAVKNIIASASRTRYNNAMTSAKEMAQTIQSAFQRND
jgi:HTH-type transcriptional regulator / antitoxin HigA